MGRDGPRRIPVIFYRTTAGRSVVRDWLHGLDARDRSAIGQDLMRVQYRWPVGMPLCRAIGEGLWEVRCDLPDNRIARLLFCTRDQEILVLHAFIKKSQKMPEADLALARKRRREFEG